MEDPLISGLGNLKKKGKPTSFGARFKRFDQWFWVQ
jgi:hypothetical protein